MRHRPERVPEAPVGRDALPLRHVLSQPLDLLAQLGELTGRHVVAAASSSIAIATSAFARACERATRPHEAATATNTASAVVGCLLSAASSAAATTVTDNSHDTDATSEGYWPSARSSSATIE